MERKTCARCDQNKALDQFYNHPRDGYSSYCRECRRVYSRERYAADATKREKAAAAVRASRKKNPEKYKALDKSGHLRRRFGMSGDEFDQMLAAQQGRCAICEEHPPEGRTLAVDHDHATGEIRGLLCNRCNPGVGYFRDDPILLNKAAVYLRR